MVIHIKIDYNEAVEAKKSSLLVEEALLKTIKHIRVYNQLRKIEFSLKNKIKKEFQALYQLIISMEKDLPEEDLKSFRLKEEIKPKSKEIKDNKEKSLSPTPTSLKLRAKQIEQESTNLTLEEELKNIREKLARLS